MNGVPHRTGRTGPQAGAVRSATRAAAGAGQCRTVPAARRTPVSVTVQCRRVAVSHGDCEAE